MKAPERCALCGTRLTRYDYRSVGAEVGDTQLCYPCVERAFGKEPPTTDLVLAGQHPSKQGRML